MQFLHRSARLPIFLLSIANLACAQPVVSAVLDGAALTANLAQGSVFAVKGTGLSNANEFFQATAPAYPTTFHNVSVSLTSVGGGAAIPMLMVYTYNLEGVNQLVGVVPSNVPVGNYNLKVTNGSATSPDFAITVVARKPGIVTADSSGHGIAQATLEGGLILQRNANVGKIGDFTTRPAHPGDRMDLWGTGLGADLASDSGGTSGDQTGAGQIRVLLNGAEIVPAYAGRSQGYPGLDQIVFTIPANVALRCDNTLEVRAGGVLSNMITISSAAGDACPAATITGTGRGYNPLTPSQVDAIVRSGQYREASVALIRVFNIDTPTGVVVASQDVGQAYVQRVTGDLQAYLTAPDYNLPPAGTCFVTTSAPAKQPAVSITQQNAGTFVIQRGATSRSIPWDPAGFYQESIIGTGTSGNFLDTGAYTLSTSGGPDLPGFSTPFNVSAPFALTNLAAVANIVRSSGVQVQWLGGSASDFMLVSVAVTETPVAGTPSSAQVNCVAEMSAQQLTIPASLLQQLSVTGSRATAVISLTSLGFTTLHQPGIDFFPLITSLAKGAKVAIQ